MYRFRRKSNFPALSEEPKHSFSLLSAPAELPTLHRGISNSLDLRSHQFFGWFIHFHHTHSDAGTSEGCQGSLKSRFRGQSKWLEGHVSAWNAWIYIYIYIYILHILIHMYITVSHIYIYSIHIMYIQMIFPWLWGCWNCLWNETPGVNLNLCLSCMACWISGFPGGLFRQQEDDLIQRCCSTHIVGSLHLLTWMVACYGKCS